MAPAPPRIKTTVVGSYPLPDWYHARPGEQSLEDAIRVFIHTQEKAGIDVVCDGDYYRYAARSTKASAMFGYFFETMGGVRTDLSFAEKQEFLAETSRYSRFSGENAVRYPPGIVDAPVTSGTLDLPSFARRSKALASHPFKMTLTGPHHLSTALVDRYYGSREKLADAIAEVLAEQVAACEADYVQVDEARITSHPEDADWAAAAVNKVLAAVKGIAAVHTCFGNQGGQVRNKEDSWFPVIAFQNRLHADHVICEMKHRDLQELEAFRELDPRIGLGLGVIDIKRTEVESPDEVARFIERAEAVVGAGRVTYVHPDCGFSNVRRDIADRKMRNLVRGRDLFEGR